MKTPKKLTLDTKKLSVKTNTKAGAPDSGGSTNPGEVPPPNLDQIGRINGGSFRYKY